MAGVRAFGRHQRRIEAARQLVIRLRAEGRTDDARTIYDLTLSSAMSAARNRSLHAKLAASKERRRLLQIELDAAKLALTRGREMQTGDEPPAEGEYLSVDAVMAVVWDVLHGDPEGRA